jgi:hypothetical protein
MGSIPRDAAPLRSPARPDRAGAGRPPIAGLQAFYWHFIRQVRWVAVALFVWGGPIAVLDATIPAFIGRVVGLVSSHMPEDLLRQTWPQLATMAGALLVLRPLVLLDSTDCRRAPSISTCARAFADRRNQFTQEAFRPRRRTSERQPCAM